MGTVRALGAYCNYRVFMAALASRGVLAPKPYM